MVRETKILLKRILVCLLAIAMITPTGIIAPQKAHAGTTTSDKTPAFSSASYRYLLVGESYDFNITNKIAGSTYKWESSDTKIATVNKAGLVKAKKQGTATISCKITSGEKTYQLKAEVYVKRSVTLPAKKVNIINEVQSILVGDKYNLNKTFVPAGSNDFVNWTSNNTNIATVDKNGIVYGIKPGSVKITASTLKGATDSVYIRISTAATVSDQNSLEKALKSSVADSIQIVTDQETEFSIPEGNYKDKSLFVNAPNSSVNNRGIFKEINIQAIKNNSWHEYAKGNNIIVDAISARIVIHEGAAASIHITRTGSNIILEIFGDADIFAEASGTIVFTGASGKVPNVSVLVEGITITTDLALKINASQKITLVLNTSTASNSAVTVSSNDMVPLVKGSGSIMVYINGVSKVIYATKPEPKTPEVISYPKEPVIPQKVNALFGTPIIDGEIDGIWMNVRPDMPRVYGKKSPVSALHRVMWDDNALYILSVIEDSTLDKTNSAAYQQDSLELFLDELYDKGTAYKSDDVHYRVNYDNFRTYDAGEKTRFYSKTKRTATGYIVEACIVWDKVTPANNLELGFELQINEAKNGTRDTTVTFFDTTGNAYQNPSLFGKLVLTGKGTGAVSGTNPYVLLSYIDSVKEIYLDAYVNKDSIAAPLAAAEAVANSRTSTQKQIDDAYAALMDAVDKLDDGSGFTKPSALPQVTDLPDVFTLRNGSKVTTLDQWNQRKQEISQMYQYYMYGVVPDQSDEVITPEFVTSYETTNWWGGKQTVTAKADQKFVKINITKGTRSANFVATATFPSTTTAGVTTITPPTREGGYPVLIVIGSLGANEKKYLNQNGYAVIEFNNGSVASDNYNRTGAFYSLYPYGKTWNTQTGVLMAWAWGVSKIVDVLELDAAGTNTLQISPVNTIVTGVSRNGKAAAVAGAFDSRIKVTAPGSSGAGGMALFRYNSAGKVHNYSSLEKQEFIEFSGETNGTNTWNNYQTNPLHTVGSNESLSNIQSGSEGHWFNDTFQGFSSPNQLPFDQHYLAALASGEDRYFYITAEVDGSDWINSQGMYAAYLAAQNVYDSLNISDSIAIHLHSTGHAFTLEDTRYLVEFCNKNFYGVMDGVKDLKHLKTSLYELPENYDPYFDTLKAMDGPVLVKAPSKVTAVFGSPYVDGEIDACWDNASVVVPKIAGKTTAVSAKHRVMWDDNALYVLSEIKDDTLDKASANAYMQDSLELFLDELYDKGTAYKSDDVHYRVNFENFRTYDAGEKSRFYSKTKRTADGYIVEACILWNSVAPVNNLQLGFDLQINEAKNGNRDTTITIYDTTGNAYQNPSLFGKLVLIGKGATAVTGKNPYALLSYIDSVKEIYLDAYVNKDIINAPLAAAEATAASPTSTQAEIDAAFAALRAAVDSLNDGSGYTKPSALPMVTELPDVFTFRNGTKVTNLGEWNLRKLEISSMYQYYMYGMARSGENVTFEDVAPHTERVFDWATWSWIEKLVPEPNQKQIKINIEKDGKTASFTATATYPSTTVAGVTTITPPTKPGGYPVLIVIGSLGANEKKYLNDNGYAVIEYNTGSVASDDYKRTGAFYNIYPYGKTYDQQTGVLMAWAWGVSKIIDVLEIDASGSNVLQISPVNTIVTGVSRNGKAAAVAGAFDPRVKVTAPGSSGAGGMALFRFNSAGHIHDYSSLEKQEFIEFDGETNGTNSWNNFQTNPLHTVGTNESLSNIQSGSEGHWFNDTFQGFSNPYQLPFDQYYLAALASGEDRYFYITAEVNGSDWINSEGMYAAYLASQRMYDSLGLSDNIGIHLHATGHAFTLEDTRYLVEFCNKNFYGVTDGVKDLSQLKTSIYELPANYNPYFDVLKNLPFPDLTGNTLYSETFENGMPEIVTTVSGSAITVAALGSGHALQVTQNGSDYFVLPILNSATGTPVSVSGSAITVSGSAITVSGAAITVTADIRYEEEPAVPVVFEIGIMMGDMIVPLNLYTEAAAGSERNQWYTVSSGPLLLTGENIYLYIKVDNVTNYYIDNIKIKS